MSLPVSFGTYEVFRIILPGVFCTGLSIVVLFLFSPTQQTIINLSKESGFLFVVVFTSIFLGFILYAYDRPKRIKAYRRLKMPSAYLKERLCDTCNSKCENRIETVGQATDTYFYVLYELFSPDLQERVLYIGSVYHVFADMRMLSFLFSIPVLGISIYNIITAASFSSVDIFGLFLGAILLLFWILSHPEWSTSNYTFKGDKYYSYIVSMQRRFIDINLDEIKKRVCKKPEPEKNSK